MLYKVVCMCVCVCVRARACVRACVCVCKGWAVDKWFVVGCLRVCMWRWGGLLVCGWVWRRGNRQVGGCVGRWAIDKWVGVDGGGL